MKIVKLKLEDIDVGTHTPKHIDEEHRSKIESMKKKIKKGHTLPPFFVMADKNSKIKYRRLDGFKRYLAYKELGYEKIDCIVVDESTNIDLDDKAQKKLVLITGYKCNNNCRFCYDANKRSIPNRTTKALLKDLTIGIKYNCDYVDILGGEPTIRKDIFLLIKKAKEMGYERICITTNGRLLSYNPFLEKLIDAGLNSIIFSIHGHNAELHDFQTRVKGSFSQLLKGLNNTQEQAKIKDIQIGSNTTITKLNYEHLPQIGEFLVKNGIKNSEFIFVDPTGEAYNNFKDLVPKITELSPYIKKLLDIGISNKIPHWHIRYFPFCYLDGYENYISEKYSPFQKEVHFGPEFTNLDVDESRKIISRVKAPQCALCKFNNFCEGVWKEYEKQYGLKELRPIKNGN